MRKIVISVLTLLLGAVSINAENYYFNVMGQEDSKVVLSVPLSSEPELEYGVDAETNNDVLLLKTDGVNKATIVLDRRYDFSYTTEKQVPGSIISSIGENKVFKSGFAVNGETVVVSGLNANTVVKVYAANGAEQVTAIANADGVAVVNIPSHLSGVVVVKAGKSSFKLIK